MEPHLQESYQEETIDNQKQNTYFSPQNHRISNKNIRKQENSSNSQNQILSQNSIENGQSPNKFQTFQSYNSTLEDQYDNEEFKDKFESEGSSLDQNEFKQTDQLSDIDEEIDKMLNEQEDINEQQFLIKNLDDGNQKDLFQKDVLQPQNKKQRFAIIKKQTKKPQKRWNQYWKTIQRFNDLLIDYCVTGEFNLMLELFEQHITYPVSVNIKSLDDWTPLHTAVSNGHVQIVNFLLEKKADIMAKTSSQRTVLHLCIDKSQIELIKIFLEKKILLINAQDIDKQTPLHYAAQIGVFEIVQLLLSYKPNLKLKNKDGFTAQEICRTIQILNLFLEQQNQSFQDYNEIQNQKYIRQIYKNNFLFINNRIDQVQNIIDKTYEIGKRKNFIKQMNKSNFSPYLEKSSSNDKLLFMSDNGPENDSNRNSFGNKTQKKKQKYFENIEKIMKVTKLKIPKSKGANNINVGPDDFQVITTLGKGSFGKVYLVKKTDSEQVYAMKTLQKDKVFGKNLIKYAQTERNVLSIINHPFIVKLHFAFQTQNKFYLVMDYCPGGDLDQKLFQVQKMNENMAKLYLAEVLLALEFLHQNKIIFRDLKPSNIVLDQDGHACLTDFGLSKEGVNNTKKLKSFCGSIAYLAPEMLNKSGHDFTIDWYLFGVLIYELLSGYPPYYNENKQKLLDNIKSAKLKFPRYFSKNASDLIEKLLKRNPDQRLGKNGAKEIKEHAFFENINFDKVLMKKYKLPTITNEKQEVLNGFMDEKDKQDLKITFSNNDDIKICQEDEKYLENWDFAIQENEHENDDQSDEEIQNINQNQKKK